MYAERKTAPIIASVRDDDTGSCKRLRSFPEMVKYVFKKNGSDQAISEYYTAILHNKQLANINRQQHADNQVS